MHKIESWFSQWVIKARWLIILLIPLLVMAVGSGAKNLQFTNNYRVFFSEENPQLKAFEQMEKTYNKEDNILFLLKPKDGRVFSNKLLAAVEKLTEESWQIPFSLRVDSISNFQHTRAEQDDLIVEDLVEDAESLDADALAEKRHIATTEPLLVNRLVNPEGSVTAVNVTLQLPGKNETTEVPQVAAAARALVAEMQQQNPDVDFYLSGMVMMNNAFAEASQGDMKTLIPLTLLVMLVVLALMIRGFTGTAVTFLVIIMSIITAMGAAGWIGYPVTPPLVSAPIIIITVAIAGSVHVLVSYMHELGKGLGKHQALSESLRINLQPIFLTSVTTAIGFLSMNFSDAPPFRHIGNVVAIGVLAAFILTVTFLPALMSVLPGRARKQGDIGARVMARLGNWVVTHQKRLLWGSLILAAILVAQVPRNSLNDNFVEYFDTTIKFRQDTDVVDKYLSGLYRINYSLNAKEPGGVSKPAFLANVQRFEEWLKTQPEVKHVNSITDIFRRLNKNMHGDDPSYYRLPENRELAAQYLLLYEMSLPYGLDLNNQINVDKSATRLSVSMPVMSTNKVLAFEERAREWMLKNTPDIHSYGSSPTIMFAHIGYRNIRSMLTGTSIALVLISMILIFAFRSFKLGLVSLIPNLVPAAVGFGIWGMTVGEVGLALSVVTGMTLGIVVDDTVHFMSKYLRARREQGLAAEDAIRYAFRSVGWALFVTSVVLVAGFLILTLSHFRLNSQMGLLTAVIIAIALIADFFLLPPLLMAVDRDQPKENT